MQRDIRTPLFFAFLFAVAWCSWLVLKPFLPGIVWASVLVVTFWPLHERLTAKLRGRSWAASLIVTLAVAGFIIVPTIIAAVQVVQGCVKGYEWVQTAYSTSGPNLGAAEHWPRLDQAVRRAMELVGLGETDAKTAAINVVKKVGAVAAAKAPGLVGSALGLAFSFFVTLGMMFVLFAEGGSVAAAVSKVLPLSGEAADRIMRELGTMTRTVFISVGLTALVQASLGTIALLVLGVPNAFTLGAAMLFVALLPGGTGLVWVPVAIWLGTTGHEWKAVILAAWGAGVISTIDNVLRPFFAKDGVKLPGMLLFLGLVGGLFAFGIVGLFVGPIVLYLLRELTEAIQQEA
jgi:predicted PurR-regulated permease PerM